MSQQDLCKQNVEPDRRAVIKFAAGGAALAAIGASSPHQRPSNNRINHSIVYCCFSSAGENWSHDKICQVAPVGKQNSISVAFTIKKAGTYSVFARLYCPTADDNSFWIKLNDDKYRMVNGLGTRGWEWVQLDSFKLDPGGNQLTIAYREDEAKLDKTSISNDHCPPEGLGQPASNLKSCKK